MYAETRCDTSASAEPSDSGQDTVQNCTACLFEIGCANAEAPSQRSHVALRCSHQRGCVSLVTQCCPCQAVHRRELPSSWSPSLLRGSYPCWEGHWSGRGLSARWVSRCRWLLRLRLLWGRGRRRQLRAICGLAAHQAPPLRVPQHVGLGPRAAVEERQGLGRRVGDALVICGKP